MLKQKNNNDMKLTKELKDRIDKYFENLTPEELQAKMCEMGHHDYVMELTIINTNPIFVCSHCGDTVSGYENAHKELYNELLSEDIDTIIEYRKQANAVMAITEKLIEDRFMPEIKDAIIRKDWDSLTDIMFKIPEDCKHIRSMILQVKAMVEKGYDISYNSKK